MQLGHPLTVPIAAPISASVRRPPARKVLILCSTVGPPRWTLAEGIVAESHQISHEGMAGIQPEHCYGARGKWDATTVRNILKRAA
jgi:hypothetical protein